MDHDIVLALIAVGPQVVVVIVVAIVLVRYRAPIADFITSRVTSVSAFGVKVDLQPKDVDAAVQERATRTGAAGATSGPAVHGTSRQLVARAGRLAPQLKGRLVLWADDQPDNNRTERRMLRGIGIFVEIATSNGQALAALRQPNEQIDLVISDIARATAPGGLALVADVAKLPTPPRVILYIRRVDPTLPTPPGVFGIADRPDDLLNLVMDALDRLDGPSRPPPETSSAAC